jgi:exonuclease III
MPLRFVSWNLNGFVRGGQAELLATTAWDVCAVQEVTSEEAFAALAEGASAHGVTARPCLAADNEPPYVCGLLAGDRRVECRYDFILASPEIRVIDAGYCWEEARMAKSDHALVWARLELS